MSERSFRILNVFVVLAIVALILAMPAQGQTPAPASKTWAPARLADGQPDMQGMYTRTGVKTTEAEPPANPIDPSGRNPLSVSNRGDGLEIGRASCRERV